MFPNILVLGAGRHGKDEFASLLCKHCPELTFQSSSLASLKFIYPELKEKYGYASEQECFEDRHNHRMEWVDLISAFNTPDASSLPRLIYSESNIYVGMRTKREYHSLLKNKLSDLILWVDASKRVSTKDPSLTIEYDSTKMVWVDNNGSLLDLDYRALFWSKRIRQMIENKKDLSIAN